MSMAAERRRISLTEYVAWEERSETKHEFFRGDIFAIAGATIPHNRISSNAHIRLGQQLEGRECEVFGSDLRVRIDAVDLSTYPDVAVVCGGPKMDAVDKLAIVNPRVIVEVLSKSTENYDRGRKFEFYQHLESFQEYIVFYQDEARAIHYVRENDGTWRYRLVSGMEATLRLDSIGCELPLGVVYRNLEFIDEPDAEDRRPGYRA